MIAMRFICIVCDIYFIFPYEYINLKPGKGDVHRMYSPQSDLFGAECRPGVG